MGISHYLVIIVSFAILLIPVSQADAIFLISSEISDDDYYKNFKEIYDLRIQKLRDLYLEEHLRLQNPYNEKISDDVIIFNGKEFNMPNSIDRYDENFQTFKDEQSDLAQKKYFEIMGGKTITSSLGDKHDKRIIPTLEFTSEEESIRKAIHRNDEGFTSYKIQQVITAEDTFNRMIESGYWGNSYVTDTLWDDFNQNRDELRDALELIEYDLISSKRTSPEFSDLIEEQMLLAEKTRNHILSFSQYPDPYEENDDVLGNNQEEIVEELEFIFSNNNHELLEFDKYKQIEIAQKVMNEMYHLKNSEENIDVEEINVKEENNKLKTIERRDQGFEFLKQIQNDEAEKKLIEILGGKEITNFIAVEYKVGRDGLKVKDDFTSNSFEEFQNYELILLTIADKIRENNYKEKVLIPSSYTVDQKIEIESKPERDPNVLCFGLGC